VPNLEKATAFYRDILGAKVSDPQPQKEHGVTTVFVHLNNTNIELLHPLGEKSPIENFLKKKPDGGIHHICLEVDDINASIEGLKSKGITPIDPKPKIGAHGKPVVFLHPRDCYGVLVELEQK
jgi:methylmalonyl-CoA/ethylmalonyl-CoA epimerase